MQSTADKIGIFLSGLCAVQCAMLPIVLSISAVVPNWMHFGHGWIWMTAIGLIALWSFSRGWQRHKDKGVIGLFILGFGFLIAGTLMEDKVHIILESAMFVIGGVLMVIAHWRNYQLMRCLKPVNPALNES